MSTTTNTTLSRTICPPQLIIREVTLPSFLNIWPSLSGHFPRSPPRKLCWHHCSPLRWSYKVGLAGAPIFLLHTSILAYTDSSMQPGLPDPVHKFAYSSTAVSAAAVAAAVCCPHIQYAIIIVHCVISFQNGVTEQQ